MKQNNFFELLEDLVLPHFHLIEAFNLQKEEENDRRDGRNLRNFKEATFVQNPLLSVFLDGINSGNGGSRDFCCIQEEKELKPQLKQNMEFCNGAFF